MQLNHYLNFKGQTEAAFLFYQSVFGGTFSNMTRYRDMPPEDGVNLTEEERNFIMHVSLPLNEHTELMGSDYMEAFCGNNAKGFMGPPKYEEAKFMITSDSKITIKMNAAH